MRRNAYRGRAIQERRAVSFVRIVADAEERNRGRIEPVRFDRGVHAAVAELRKRQRRVDHLVVPDRPAGVRIEDARVAVAHAIARSDGEAAALEWTAHEGVNLPRREQRAIDEVDLALE